MKRVLSVIVSMLLVVGICFTFYGCGSDEKKIIGEWKCKADFTKYVNDELGKEDELKSLIGDFKFKNLTLDFTFVFDEDGKVEFSCSDKARDKFSKEFTDQFIGALSDKLSGLGITEDQIRDEFADSSDAFVPEIDDEESYYKIEDGKIYLSDDEDSFDDDDDSYFEYKFENKDELIFESCSDKDAENLFGEFPATLERQK